MRQMSGITVRLGEVDLMERLHAGIKVHAPQRGRIERGVVGGQNLSRELGAELSPHTGKVYGGVVDASVTPVNDARKMAGSGSKSTCSATRSRWTSVGVKVKQSSSSR